MYGHRVDASLAMGYVTLDEPVTQALLDSASIQVEVACRRVPAAARLSAWYDPRMLKVRS